MSETVFRFGAGKACTSIEVAPFTPICSKPAVPGSEALTLEVPAPVFVPVVPPQECACFTFTKSEKPQVTVTMAKRSDLTSVLEAGKTGTGTASVDIAATGDCCNGAYEVTPTIAITIPECITADKSTTKTVALSNNAGGSITYKYGIANCEPFLEITTSPMNFNFDGSVNLCLADTSIKVKAKYADPDSATGYSYTPEVTANATQEYDGGCPKYKFDGIEIDLTGMPTGAFGNGGSVFKDEDDNNLYMDGGLGDGDTWYGGGIGDRAANNYEEQVFCRGPAMRGYASPAGSGDHPVPYVNNVSGDTSLFKITADGGTRQAVAWCSRARASDGSDAVGATPSGYVDGNLSMVLPTGFQWHAKGLAINLCDFEWNESGLLSLMHETGMAVLVSPTPMVFSDNAAAYATGAPRAGAAAGGLRIDPDRDTTLKTEPGLYIAAGDGLRIFGLDAKTPSGEGSDASGMAAAGRIGQLEVMYGPGFRVRTANSGTTPQYLDAPVDAAGALVPNEGRGLRVHGVTKTTTAETDNGQKNKLEVYGHSGDFLFNYDGKMALNDEKAPAAPFSGVTGEEILAYPGYGSSGRDIPSWGRNTDCTVPVVVPQYDLGATGTTGTYWAVNSYGSWQVRTGPAKTAIDNADAALKKSDGTYITHADGSSTVHAAALNSLQKVVDALYKLLYTLGTLHVVPMHFSRSGNLMAIDKNEDSQAVARHYAASAS